MYAGVPSAVPGSVSALPLAELGMSVRSAAPGSLRPVALARPQSTTKVSPCLPTMMLPGLISRCSTPRVWAYSRALQTSMKRRSNFRSSRVLRPDSFFDDLSAWKPSIASLSESPRMNRMA
jgi:hypothetical protein